MGFGYRLYLSYNYNGYNDISGKGIDKMIDQLIAKHDDLPALPAERRLLFFHLGAGGAEETITHRTYRRIARRVPRVCVGWARAKRCPPQLPHVLHQLGLPTLLRFFGGWLCGTLGGPRRSRCRWFRIYGLLRDGMPRDTEREAMLHHDAQPEGLSDATLATILDLVCKKRRV